MMLLVTSFIPEVVEVEVLLTERTVQRRAKVGILVCA